MLTVEELLRDRYKVIADYFYNPYKIGDIITVMYDDRSVHLTTTRYRDEFGEMKDQHNYMHPGQLKNYPHLFQPLPWWSDRKVEDMPAFVKLKNMKDEIEVHKVKQWNERNGMPFVEGFGTMIVREMMPATDEEYELFKQKEK